MKRRCAVSLVVCALAISGLAEAAPGFRIDRSVSGPAIVKLRIPGKFGPTVIPGTPLTVVHRKNGLYFSDPRTMQPIAQIPCRVAPLKVWHQKATIQFYRQKRGKKKRLYLTYRFGKKECTAIGWDAPGASMRKAVLIENGPRSRPAVKGMPAEKTEAQLLARGLNRYLSSVVHCATKAEKFRWKTGEKKLARCVCPILESWRLPPVKENVRVSTKIMNFKMGLSLTVNTKGRAENCSPWVGRTPPPPEPPFLQSLLKDP